MGKKTLEYGMILLERIPILFRVMKGIVHEVLEEQSEITMSQFHILRHLRRGECSVNELSRHGRISPPAVSRTVEALVQEGLATRIVDPDNRRSVIVGLSSTGADVLADLDRGVAERFSTYLDEMDTKELGTIVEKVGTLLRAFEGRKM